MVYLDPSTEVKAAELATALDESLSNRSVQVRIYLVCEVLHYTKTVGCKIRWYENRELEPKLTSHDIGLHFVTDLKRHRGSLLSLKPFHTPFNVINYTVPP